VGCPSYTFCTISASAALQLIHKAPIKSLSNFMLTLCIMRTNRLQQNALLKKRLYQQGSPCLHESRKKFSYGASTRQTSIIKLGRKSLVGIGRVLNTAKCYFLDIFSTSYYDFDCILLFDAIECVFRSRVSFFTLHGRGQAY